MATTVISVRGRDRAALLADPSFVYVGRRCAGWTASPVGNPCKVGRDGTPVEVIALYRDWLLNTRPDLLDHLPRLRGKVLGCWCGDWRAGEPDLLCHAVVLAQMADSAEQIWPERPGPPAPPSQDRKKTRPPPSQEECFMASWFGVVLLAVGILLAIAVVGLLVAVWAIWRSRGR